jgi:hypothetical protein
VTVTATAATATAAMMGREDDTLASSGDWKYDGDKKLYKRTVRKITMRLQKDGGPSLAKHWDGAMSYCVG